jgi:hypothetical protein
MILAHSEFNFMSLLTSLQKPIIHGMWSNKKFKNWNRIQNDWYFMTTLLDYGDFTTWAIRASWTASYSRSFTILSCSHIFWVMDITVMSVYWPNKIKFAWLVKWTLSSVKCFQEPKLRILHTTLYPFHLTLHSSHSKKNPKKRFRWLLWRCTVYGNAAVTWQVMINRTHTNFSFRLSITCTPIATVRQHSHEKIQNSKSLLNQMSYLCLCWICSHFFLFSLSLSLSQ